MNLLVVIVAAMITVHSISARTPLTRKAAVDQDGSVSVGKTALEAEWVFGLSLPRSTGPGLITISRVADETGSFVTDSKWTYWPSYRGSNSEHKDWVSPLYDTLSPFTDQDAYYTYSDNVADEENSQGHSQSGGHAKGMVHRSSSPFEGHPRGEGLWLHTSSPRFPLISSGKWTSWIERGTGGVAIGAGTNMAAGGRRNGQHFVLLSLPAVKSGEDDPMHEVAAASRANIWENYKNAASFTSQILPSALDILFHEATPPVSADKSRWLFNRTAGVVHFDLRGLSSSVRVFAVGSTKFEGDLANYISQHLEAQPVRLMCQTWWQQGMLAPTPSVGNVRLVRPPEEGDIVNADMFTKIENEGDPKTHPTTWAPTYDHSKWCVAAEAPMEWACALSLNRAVTQAKKRGGDAICIKDGTLAHALHKLVLVNENVGEDEKPSYEVLNDNPPPPQGIKAPDGAWSSTGKMTTDMFLKAARDEKLEHYSEETPVDPSPDDKYPSKPSDRVSKKLKKKEKKTIEEEKEENNNDENTPNMNFAPRTARGLRKEHPTTSPGHKKSLRKRTQYRARGYTPATPRALTFGIR